MPRKKLTEDFDPKKIGANPFTSGLRILAAEIRETKKLFEAQSFEDNVFVNVGEKRELFFVLERDAYTKMYKSAEIRKRIARLSGRATKLYMWIMYETKASKDYIVINIDRYKEEAGVHSSNTYTTAIKELIEAELIKRVKNNIYWVNPRYFFSGNRLKKYIDNVIIYNGKNKKTKNEVSSVKQQSANKARA